MDTALIDHGAVVFRGFPIVNTDSFRAMIDQMSTHSMGYAGGAALRKGIKGQVMEATRIGSSFYIQLHQEMSYLPNNPRLLGFFCKVPAETGGATVIADMRRVTAALPIELREKFATKGVRYTRNLLSPDASDGRTDPVFGHNNWVANFGTDDKAKVEEACRERGLVPHWREDGSLDLVNNQPALTKHPKTGDVLYFNQAHVQIARRHAYGEAAYQHMIDVYGDLPKAFDACFGDGTPLSDEELDQIYEALHASTVSFPWKAGDVMFVENKFTAHGREPFTGHRDTQVALFD
jgi:alpha-ketoglutarate-dependent taurine dioxygenase